MPTLDSTAKAAAAAQTVAPVFYVFLDVVGDPVRATTYGAAVTFAATGDGDLDGTYSAVDPRMLDVGSVTNQDSGSDTLTVTLSGIASIDTALLNEIGDTSKWRGRVCRLWMQVRDASGATQGAIVPYYTGYMSSVTIVPAPKSQSIQLHVENYLAAFNQASNRSYQSQASYDPADTSAAATLGAANGGRGPAGAVMPGVVSHAGSAGGDNIFEKLQ